MPDPNELIVKQVLELEGYFVRTNVRYLTRKNPRLRKIRGWTDFDLIAIHPKKPALAIEVSAYHYQKSYPPSNLKSVRDKDRYFDRESRQELRRILGPEGVRTVLVISKVTSPDNRKALGVLAHAQGIDELWTFGDLLNRGLAAVKDNRAIPSELGELFRYLRSVGIDHIVTDGTSSHP